jgi:hypothetical protein
MLVSRRLAEGECPISGVTGTFAGGTTETVTIIVTVLGVTPFP